MTTFEIIAVILVLAAIGGYLNHRYMKFPATIGHMAFALLVSLTAIVFDALDWLDLSPTAALVGQIDFSELLLHGILSFLLFAGALHINVQDLKNVRWSVGTLATFGVMVATLVTGTLIWLATNYAGLELPYIHALLFGALIAPTDPIAVLAILKDAKVPRRLYAKIGGESLFNDGTAVVLFLALLELSRGGEAVDIIHIPVALVREVVGGIILGWALGWGVLRLMRSIDEHKLEVMMTLALVAGGYALAELLHVSAPICTVTSGLLIGNRGSGDSMSIYGRMRLDVFWELLDDILNSVLFMLMGLQIIVIMIHGYHLALGAFAIIAVLAGRFISVGLPLGLLRRRRRFDFKTYSLFTWGGLRGGISIAMVLSLPTGEVRDLLLPITYIVVLFSILVQGLTFKRALPFLLGPK